MFSLLEQAKTLKESPFMILENLNGYFSKILLTKFLLAEQASPQAIAARLKIPPFFAKDYMNYAQKFDRVFLTDAICRVNQIDCDIKRGKAQDWLSIEQFLANCILYQKKS
jgi:DNA polymerase III delta subunit